VPSWSDLLEEQRGPDWDQQLFERLGRISELGEGAAVVFYASAFLQKAVEGVSIRREDMNGFMNALLGVEPERKLVLVLHTPGGDPNAVESIVEYLHSKFSRIEVIVPYIAMSGGAMISLAGDSLVLGRQSQLGPIDPQLQIGNKSYSARAIKEGFDQARKNIERDTRLAHLWAPILQNMGPSLFLEAEKALKYSKELVLAWLKQRMFSKMDDDKRNKQCDMVASYFNAEKVKSHGCIHVHGQRIGTDKLLELGLNVQRLEENPELQEEILTAYHLMTLIFENGPSLKFIATNAGKMWAKQQQQVIPQAGS